jgi:hypothetical protein
MCFGRRRARAQLGNGLSGDFRLEYDEKEVRMSTHSAKPSVRLAIPPSRLQHRPVRRPPHRFGIPTTCFRAGSLLGITL